MALPPCVTPLDEVALIDEAAVALGQDLGALMERAGAAIAREADRLVPQGDVVVACGPGNNGGDGYVAARLLAQAGRTVHVWPVVAPASPLCLRAADALPATVLRLDGPRPPRRPSSSMPSSALVPGAPRGVPWPKPWPRSRSWAAASCPPMCPRASARRPA